jgi:hypothetical protein
MAFLHAFDVTALLDLAPIERSAKLYQSGCRHVQHTAYVLRSHTKELGRETEVGSVWRNLRLARRDYLRTVRLDR